ncbi:MAG: hypothetical protein JJT99_12480 [Rhodobacteraceae bacterium]|nr:hypothetical protein [Paracoccaceae bacterium]
MNKHPSSLRKSIEESYYQEASPPEITAERATVRINIAPAALPTQVLAFVDVEKIIFDTFRSTLNRSRVSLPPEAANVNNKAIVQYLIQNDKPVVFSGGFDDRGETGFVNIVELGFGSQSIFARVYGTTGQAEVVCKQLLEKLWSATGLERKWRELVEYVNLVAYESSTKVDFGFPMKDFLSKVLNGFLSDEIERKEGFGARMGNIGQQPDRSDDSFLIVTSCRKLSLDVDVIDTLTGKSETSNIEIIPHTVFDHNRNLCKVQSELPFEDHVEMLQKLISKYKRAKSVSDSS